MAHTSCEAASTLAARNWDVTVTVTVTVIDDRRDIGLLVGSFASCSSAYPQGTVLYCAVLFCAATLLSGTESSERMRGTAQHSTVL